MPTLFLPHPLIFYITVTVIGLCVGSCCNVVIYRLPLMLHDMWRREALNVLQREAPYATKIFNLFLPRSHCPKCQRLIPIWLNIPVISYILLRGKCAHCHENILWRYPMVELLGGLTSLIVAIHFGPGWQMVAVLLLSWGLIVLIFIDLDHQLLPDNLTLPLLWLGLLANNYHLFVTPADAIWGAACGYGGLWLVAKGFKLIRKQEGMGHGDFKLLALCGAWLGWQALPAILLISSLAGSIVGITLILCRKQRYNVPLPFGPYIAVAGWLMIFVNPGLFYWYARAMGGG